jgi:tripartite ATP-independent transporter DctP family solute receptor
MVAQPTLLSKATALLASNIAIEKNPDSSGFFFDQKDQNDLYGRKLSMKASPTIIAFKEAGLMLKRHWPQCWVVILFLFLLGGCAPKAIDYEQVSEDEKIVIRFSHVVGEDTPKGQAARLFAKLMDEKTNGKVEVQVFANGSLYKDPEELKALRDGYIHMIAPSLSKLTPLAPELGVFDLPFLYSSIEDYHRAFEGEIGTLLMGKVRRQGLVPLSFWDNGFKQFTNNVRPIVNPDDLSGTTVRIMPSSVLDQQFALLKAKPVEMSFNDVYSALEQGLVNGQENTTSNIFNKRFYKVQQYMTVSDHGYIGYMVLMDRKFWDKLPSNIQNHIREAIEQVTEWERQKALQINTEQFIQIDHCQCIEIVTLTNAQKEKWKHFFKPLYVRVEQNLDKDFIGKLKAISD